MFFFCAQRHQKIHVSICRPSAAAGRHQRSPHAFRGSRQGLWGATKGPTGPVFPAKSMVEISTKWPLLWRFLYFWVTWTFLWRLDNCGYFGTNFGVCQALSTGLTARKSGSTWPLSLGLGDVDSTTQRSQRFKRFVLKTIVPFRRQEKTQPLGVF